MERKNDILCDAIDVENLFSQWHPDVRKFVKNIDKDCALRTIQKTQISTFPSSRVTELFNFANTNSCKRILDRIVNEKNISNFFSILKERDNLYPRDISRKYSIEQIFESIEKNNYNPLLFLVLNNKYYIIDGRTRFYCCMFLNIPAKVRIVLDDKLNENCRK